MNHGLNSAGSEYFPIPGPCEHGKTQTKPFTFCVT